MILGGLLAALCACTGAPPVTAPVPVPAPAEISATLLLIGDAGKPRPGGEPVFDVLTRAAGEHPSRTTVVFLGDNVYPSGIPDSAAPQRGEMERRLHDQIAAARAAGVRAIFIPGNHDWDKSGKDGWRAIRRQEALIAAAGPDVALLPRNGCPGPEVVDIGERVRLVLIDTQWWLHGGPRPQPSDSTCAVATRPAVVDSLRGALAAAGNRVVVVAGHHPLESGGEHGGRFSLGDHLFPLRAVKSWLWIPLPVIGSIYPVSRMLGISPQDMPNGTNERMRADLREAFADHPPLAYVAGHEHALQVFRPAEGPWILGSGAGIVHHEGGVGWRRDSRYKSSSAGFMRLDLLEDGRVRLGVWTVTPKGESSEGYSTYLTP